MNTQMAKARNIHQSQTELIFVTEVGSLSTRAKFATQFFVRRVFAIFAINASFLCVIQFSIICNMSHCQMLGKVESGLPAKI